MLSWFGTADKKMAAHPKAAAEDQSMLNVATEPKKDKAVHIPIKMPTADDIDRLVRYADTSEKMTITPEIASAMMAWNTQNRPCSAHVVRRYASIMREGRWRFTGEPIIFSKDRLIDGQHRLFSCIAADRPFDAIVVFGAPDDAFAYIDMGKTRTAGDIFAINGVKYHNVISASAQWVFGYLNNNLSSESSKAKIEHAELYEFYLNHQGLMDSVWVINLFARARMVSPSMMGGIHYLCAKKNRHEADDFFRRLGEGIGFTGKKDPAYKLHKYFVDAAVSQKRPTRKVAAALTIKAWNAHRRGRDVGLLRYGVDETFPRII